MKTKYTPESIMVTPINKEQLDKYINAHFHGKTETPANHFFETRGKLAIINEPKHCVIDEEFIGHDIDDSITFNIYESTKTDNGGSFSVIPTYEAKYTMDDLKPYLDSPVTLAEFTKARRGYNSRIQGNEYQWVKYLNS